MFLTLYSLEYPEELPERIDTLNSQTEKDDVPGSSYHLLFCHPG